MTAYASPSRADRGQSLSVFVAVVSVGLILIVGLVVDGGQQVAATRQSQTLAAAAARAGADAGAAERVAGRPAPSGEVITAARSALAVGGVEGTVGLVSGGSRVRVETSVTRPTYFLSLIGIGSVTARGSAEADLVEVG